MIPVRSCVGCGTRAPQRELVRFVAADGALRLESPRGGRGRGAYLHARPDCVARFRRAKGPIRSLRRAPEARERQRLADELTGSSIRNPR